MQGMQEIRVGMMEIGRGLQGTGGGKEATKSENLCIGVELMNYNSREGQEIRNCVFLVKV